ncbi:uncharacterized protein [Lolium perenne]|uniref:uncharacterized protein n=1 Tax=Lolium perenne TaxID=4522 RepID=UPI0021F62D5D|nr:uncharacterized protein LOC127332640 isoform X2 [Lolium perenne]
MPRWTASAVAAGVLAWTNSWRCRLILWQKMTSVLGRPLALPTGRRGGPADCLSGLRLDLPHRSRRRHRPDFSGKYYCRTVHGQEEPQGDSLGCDVATGEVVMADQMLARISALAKEGWCIRVVSKCRGKASNREAVMTCFCP